MTYQLRTANPRYDKGLVALLDHAFQRQGRESKLVHMLSRHMPSFDPTLSLVATKAERDVAFALFLPRRFRIRGCEVPLAISSPFCTIPDARGEGAGRFLLEIGLAALEERGIRGALALGGGGFFARHGYRGAFNLYTINVHCDTAKDPDSHTEWDALTTIDLPHLEEIYADNYSGVNGSELRAGIAIDWESSSKRAHTLVTRHRGRPIAYLRFRLREKLEVMECGAQDPQAVEKTLSLISRLAKEHGQSSVEVHLPPPHPVFRALFRAGHMVESNNFHDEARLRVTDWEGFFEDIKQSFQSALTELGGKPISFGIETESGTQLVGLDSKKEHSVNVTNKRAKLHLDLPLGWAEPLMTGRMDWRDLYFSAGPKGAIREDFGRKLCSLLFPVGTPMWTYAPIFEIAD